MNIHKYYKTQEGINLNSTYIKNTLCYNGHMNVTRISRNHSEW